MDGREFSERLEKARLLAGDPVWAADCLGLEWPALTPEERQMVIDEQRESLAWAIERLRRRAAAGEVEARLALGELGVKLKRPSEDVRERIRRRVKHRNGAESHPATGLPSG